MWLGVKKPCKTHCMSLSLSSSIKINKSSGALEACMGIGNLPMLTLKTTGGMGISEGLCSR